MSESIEDKVISAYNNLATTYDDDRYKKSSRRWQDKMERSFVCQHVKSNSKLLEVGCGTGRITRELLRTSKSVTAVDVSGEMLKVMRSKLSFPNNLQTIETSIYDLPEQSILSDYDVVIGLRVLPHLEDTAKALNNMVRTLVPGGQAIFDLWNNQSLLGLGRRLLGRKHRIPTFHHTYNQMHQLIKEAGLEIINELPLWIYPRVSRFSLDGINRLFVKKYAYAVVFDTRKTFKAE